MATGPWHYREAERLLAEAADWTSDDLERRPTLPHFLLALASVHARLALAAATALGLDPEGPAAGDVEAWERVCSVVPAAPMCGVCDDPEHPGAACPVCGCRWYAEAGQ